VIGHPMHCDAAVVVQELGGDASNFAARQLTAKIASGVDLVVTMTRAHRDAVLTLAPNKLHKTFTLIEAARLVTECKAKTIKDLSPLRPHLAAAEVPDIDDPIGQDPEVFSRVGSQIAELLPPILELCRSSECPDR
jgi:protein-tyrosine phosphatase